ncbi:MAG: DUF2931 family protein [Pseudomonadaceae bacterium]|nr:DUF2931 family protein [Pseudomonadaceae bacterium]
MSRVTGLLSSGTILLLGLLLSSCAVGAGKSMPYERWFLGFAAPAYMEVWIETAQVVDIQKQAFRGAGGGIASVATPPNNQGNPKGWVNNSGGGKGRYVTGADLPRLIYVRWQSMVEPQTYEVFIEIPESAREIMRKAETTYCPHSDKPITDYRSDIGIGLAPGGIAKVWLSGPCLNPVEITRVEATIVKVGPDGGKSGGRYDPLTEPSKAYVEKFGIPYGSW